MPCCFLGCVQLLNNGVLDTVLNDGCEVNHPPVCEYRGENILHCVIRLSQSVFIPFQIVLQPVLLTPASNASSHSHTKTSRTLARKLSSPTGAVLPLRFTGRGVQLVKLN